MKILTMSKYIISIFICLIFNYSFSQEEQDEVIEDSLKIEQKYGIRIGLDLSKQVRMITEDYNGISLYGDLRIKERLFIVAEIGNDDKKNKNKTPRK